MKTPDAHRYPALSFRAVLAFMALLLASGAAPGAAQSIQREPGQFTPEDFKSLAWLEGSWKGTGEGVGPFYERYRMTSDSTMEITFFSDAAFTRESDRPVTVHLSGGQIYYRSGNALWAASEFSGRRIRFAPHRNVSNHFTFSRQSPKVWTAVLQWPNAQPERADVTYRLERLEM